MRNYEAQQPREVYPNQEGIEKRIREHLLSTRLNHPFVDEARLMGSLAFGQFGVYYEPERKHEKPKIASDVDLLVIADENYPVPSDWIFNRHFIFFDVYNLGTLTGIEGVQDNIHDVDAWVYFPSQANEKPRLTESQIDRMKREKDPRLEFKTKREWLEWQLAEHTTKSWRRK